MTRVRAKLKERRPGEIHTLSYWFIFPDDTRKFVGDLKIIMPMHQAIKNFKFLRGRPQCESDLVNRGECSFKDQNGVRHLIQVKLDPETKY